ncbi:MAG: Uma2 family endonuclease [Chloroflexota bacterium]
MVEKHLALHNVIAQGVTFEDYMQHFAADFAEWVEGDVVKMSPVTDDHDGLFQFLILLLQIYMGDTDEGLIRVAPFVMKITPASPAREPDLQIILKSREAIVHRTMIAGAADIVIEIVSEESQQRDTETKFAEYQAGGVREYWLLNPLNKTSRFYRLASDGLYKLVELPDGIFRSTVLPHFMLNTALLWQTPLPNAKQIAAMVESMLKS